MKLLRLLTPAAILLTCATYTLAQQPTCQLKQAPEFDGFSIGMFIDDVKDHLADPSMFEAKMSARNKSGAQAFQILGSELKDEYSEGIEDINLTFVDKKLAVIKATYNAAMTWSSAQDFFKRLSDKLGVPQPSSANPSRGRGNDKYRVDCAGFTVIMAYAFGVSPNLTIYDTLAQKLVEERNEKNPDGDVKDIRMKPGRPPRTNPAPQPNPVPTR
ncbi:MAG: hypothetical protein QOJ02_4141 [Acidobacteriota bacterium]|nr:hypothetical protein [Acidobacteriota bacterium]